MAVPADTRVAPSAHPHNPEATHSGTFDPADWLARYTALGGVYVANGRLNLCILVNDQTDEQLSQVRELVVALTDDDKAAILAHIHSEKPAQRITWQDAVARYEAAEEALRDHPWNDSVPTDPNHAQLDADHTAACVESRHAYLGVVNFPAPDHEALSYKIKVVADAYGLDEEASRPILRDIDRLAERPGANPDADAAIIAAFERRRVAYASLENCGTEAGSSSEENRLWEIIRQAEAVMKGRVAVTPAGVSAQLWVALYTSTPDARVDRACQRGDLAAVEAIASDLDFNDQMLVAALRSLKGMEAAYV